MFERYLQRTIKATLAASLYCSTAAAQLTPLERATAEALFQEGVSLMDQGAYEKACEKFAGTLEMEAGLGTMLHLADCYDKLHRTASSWALFEEVAARAKSAGDTVRYAIASERASDLKTRLTLLYLRFDPLWVPASETFVELSGTRLPKVTWTSPIPVDPGAQRLIVGASGHRTWSTTLELPEGPAQHRVLIPRLEPLPRPFSAASQPSAVLVTPKGNRQQREAPAPSAGVLHTLGYVTGALGLVSLGIGGYFGYRAYESQQRSLDECRTSNSNLCTPDGVELRQSAQRFAQAANLAVIGGGFGVVTGSVLLVVSPGSTASPNTAAGPIRLQAEPSITLHGTF